MEHRILHAAALIALAGGPASAEVWQTIETPGDWVAREASGTPDGRICAAATHAEDGAVALALEVAEGIVSVVVTNNAWAVAEPGPVDGYRFVAENGDDFPLVPAFAYADTLVSEASDGLLDHIARDVATEFHGPEGPLASFSLSGSAAALRAMRACAGL